MTSLRRRRTRSGLSRRWLLPPTLFHTVVSAAYLCGRQRDAAMAAALLERGASRATRASLRKFLDWREAPGWHEARDVTPAAWGTSFPEPSWVSAEALQLLGTS